MNLYEDAVKIMEEGQYREVLACPRAHIIQGAQLALDRLLADLEKAESARSVDSYIDVNRRAAAADKRMGILLRSRWPRHSLLSQTDYYGKTAPDGAKIRHLIQDGIALFLEVLQEEVAQDAREQGR